MRDKQIVLRFKGQLDTTVLNVWQGAGVRGRLIEIPGGDVNCPTNRDHKEPAWFAAADLAVSRNRNLLGMENLLFVSLFVIYGLVAIPIFALLTPAFQVGDEIAHFLRADQVALGQLIGKRAGPTQSGGVVDQSISDSFNLFYPIIQHPERKETTSILRKASTIGWNKVKSFRQFENTSIYPPFYYMVSAFAIRIGKLANLSVSRTLKLSRLMNGVTAILLGAVALGLAGSAAPWFFALLTLPMTLFQMASASQDALLIPMAAVAAALFVRLLRQESHHRIEFGLLCVLLGLIGMGRVSYVALALLPLALSRPSLRARLAGCTIAAAAGLGWAWIAWRIALVPFGLPGADAPAQIHYLIAHPSSIIPLIVNTMRYQWDLYVESFVGKLGWLDLSLPHSYIVIAIFDLVMAALASFTVVAGWKNTLHQKMIVLFAMAASIGILFAALYISWSPVGDFIVGGVQGRYFIPLAFFLAALFSARSSRRPRATILVCRSMVAAFPLITIPIVLVGIVSRYYLS